MRTYQGSKIDQLIHEHVMGIKPAKDLDIPGMRIVSAEKPAVPPYSLDVGLAWNVLNSPKLCCWSMKKNEEDGIFTVQVEYEGNRHIAQGEEVAQVICIVVLRALGVDVPVGA